MSRGFIWPVVCPGWPARGVLGGALGLEEREEAMSELAFSLLQRVGDEGWNQAWWWIGGGAGPVS